MVCINIDKIDVCSIGIELEVCVTSESDVLIVSIGIKIEVGSIKSVGMDIVSIGSKRDVVSGRNRNVVNSENVEKLVVKI